jgi:thiamine-monophosphate kinase
MNESDWIKTHIAPMVDAEGAVALTDDVALLTASGPTIVTMDTLVEGTHFLPTDPIDTVGQKLIRVNVSDIFAKGALPGQALLSIAWPKQRSEMQFASLMAGISRDLRRFDTALIGGDLVGTDGPLTLTLTLTGSCLSDHPVRRSGGQIGQAVYVSGEIGWGGVGLAAARAGGSSAAAEHYRVPDIGSAAMAKQVAQIARASMDVSDGLLIDASRLAEASGCGVRLDLDHVPLARPTDDLDKILEQCTAGDDYKILMTAEPEVSIPGFTKFGMLTESRGLKLAYRESCVNLPSTLGFEH